MQNFDDDDVWSGNHLNLVDLFTREEIEVEFILDCLFAESQIQKTTDALNIIANSVLEFFWKIGEWSEYYTTVCHWQKLRVHGSLQSKESSFNNFIWAFVNWNFKEALYITNNVLYCQAPTGEQGRPKDKHIRRKIESVIKVLNKHTCPNINHWEGHPCIPRRVFGPKEYLIDPLLQLSKPKMTSRPLPAVSGGFVLTSHQPRSQLGSFEATRTQQCRRSSESMVWENAVKMQFITWFNMASANLNLIVKWKALLASRDATSAIIVEAQWEREEPAGSLDPCQPKATHGCPNTRVKYWAETADIRFVKECESSGQLKSNKVGCWQKSTWQALTEQGF